MRTYICVYFGAAVTVTFGMPLLTRMARALGLLDEPGVRKVHRAPIPRVGGLAIAVATLLWVIPVLLVDNGVGEAFRRIQVEILVLLAGATAMLLVGFFDDLWSLPAGLKLVTIVGTSMALCATGARIQHLALGNVALDLGWVSWPVTVAWICTITVGINFIDGLDGLAGGVAAIVCASIAFFAFWTGQVVMVVLMLGLLGALTGFLFFNVHPAKVFMGDCGSMFLGYMIGAGSVACQAKSATLVGLALPALALGVPLMDTMLTMIRRGIIDRRSVFAAERGHLHHRLLDRGLEQRGAVLVIYTVSAAGAAVGLSMLVYRGGVSLLLLGAGVLGLFLVFSLCGATRFRETLAAIRRNRTLAGRIKTGKSVFETAQLRLRESRTLDDWWQGLCEFGSKLEFLRLAVHVPGRAEPDITREWTQPPPADASGRTLQVIIHVPLRSAGEAARIEADISVDGFLESSGHRSALLGRIIDEFPPPAAAAERPRVAEQSEPEPAALPRRNRRGRGSKDAGGREPGLGTLH
ncbi:MAG: undecaprenyl/decaprenyl-phosphate alpha-N-acetylglucosaminyl 1-phosphate transferase [Planctomycetes bacterium]|nr:undecaprenyl/decaprenyl-phosphate alpha-N-acetylglucosaminyl 1-phosphate transferase [Planctomycetota bacterium]